MNIPRPVLIGLIVIAVLGVVFLGIGVGRGDTSADPDDHGWAELFRFGGGPRVAADEIQSACFDRTRGRFQFASGCAATVADSGDRARLLELEVPGSAPLVRVTLVPGDDEAVSLSDVDIKSGDDLTASVGPRGADLTFTCLTGPPPCIVLLAP